MSNNTHPECRFEAGVLSSRSAQIARSTLLAVGAFLGTITELFYRRMFEEHPELLRDLFNRANQTNGAQREALTGTGAAFANKHSSSGITSDRYTLVARRSSSYTGRTPSASSRSA